LQFRQALHFRAPSGQRPAFKPIASPNAPQRAAARGAMQIQSTARSVDRCGANERLLSRVLVVARAAGSPTPNLDEQPFGDRALLHQQNRAVNWRNVKEIETRFDLSRRKVEIVQPPLDFLALVEELARLNPLRSARGRTLSLQKLRDTRRRAGSTGEGC
jgi:hypothetical protein